MKKSSLKAVCPLCNNPLGEKEKQKLDERFADLIKKESVEKIKEVKAEAEKNAKESEKKIIEVKEEKEKAVEKERIFFKDFFDKQLDTFKKQLAEQTKTEKGAIEKEKEQLSGQLKELQQKMKDEITCRSKEKIDDLTREYDQKIGERDKTIERLDKDIKSLKATIDSTSGELKGTAGEFNLYARLRDAFPEDDFDCAKRGQHTVDIIHHIRRDPTHIVIWPIVYDNKAAEKVTQKDIDKAKDYRGVHNTNYVIIVCANPPQGHTK